MPFWSALFSLLGGMGGAGAASAPGAAASGLGATAGASAGMTGMASSGLAGATGAASTAAGATGGLKAGISRAMNFMQKTKDAPLEKVYGKIDQWYKDDPEMGKLIKDAVYQQTQQTGQETKGEGPSGKMTSAALVPPRPRRPLGDPYAAYTRGPAQRWNFR